MQMSNMQMSSFAYFSKQLKDPFPGLSIELSCECLSIAILKLWLKVYLLQMYSHSAGYHGYHEDNHVVMIMHL